MQPGKMLCCLRTKFTLSTGGWITKRISRIFPILCDWQNGLIPRKNGDRLLNAAVKIYKGYFAPDVAEHWAITERERFHQQALEAMVSLAELQLKRGELNEMLVTAQTLLDFDPTHEIMVCLIMRAQAALGNLVAVMQQYDQFKRILYKEMGARPSPQTRALFENLTRARRVTR